MSGGQKMRGVPRGTGRTARRVPLTEAEVLALPASVSVETAAQALNVGEDKALEMLRDPSSGLRPVPGISRPLRVTRRSLLELLEIPVSDAVPAQPVRVAS